METIECGKRYTGNQIINIFGYERFQDMKDLGILEKVGIVDGSNVYLVKT